MGMLNLVLTLSLARASLASPLDVDATLPPAKEVTVGRPSSTGTGCRKQPISLSISPDRTVMTLGLDEFQVYTGPGMSPAEKTKECRVSIDVSYPSGYTFSVAGATYRGYARLDDGVMGRLNTWYSFPSAGAGINGKTESSTQANVTWPAGVAPGYFTRSEDIPVASRVRAPCGGNVTLLARTRISMTSMFVNREGEMMTGEEEGLTATLIHLMTLEWEACAQ